MLEQLSFLLTGDRGEGLLRVLLVESVFSADVSLDPVNVFGIAALDSRNNYVGTRIILVLGRVGVNESDEAGDLVIGGNHLESITIVLSLHSAELDVGTLEVALVHVDAGDESLSEQLLDEPDGVLIIVHSERDERNTSLARLVGGLALRFRTCENGYTIWRSANILGEDFLVAVFLPAIGVLDTSADERGIVQLVVNVGEKSLVLSTTLLSIDLDSNLLRTVHRLLASYGSLGTDVLQQSKNGDR